MKWRWHVSERDRIEKLFSFGMPAYHVLRLMAAQNISAGKARELILGILFGGLTFDNLPCLNVDVVSLDEEISKPEPLPLRRLAFAWEHIAENGDATPVTDSFNFRCGMERCAAELRAELGRWDEKLVEVSLEQSGSIAIQSLRMRMIGTNSEES
jgi:hypothetical protein